MASRFQSTITQIPIELDDRPVRKRIGFIALATDHTSERDFARICDTDQVGIYTNRIAFENPTTHESLAKTGPRITQAAAQILPDEDLDVIAYGCTAASIVLGNDAVTRYLHGAKPGTPCVTPSSAAFDAFETLDIKRISILTPYTADVTDELAHYFTKNGPDVVSASCLGLSDDRHMARVSQQSIIDVAISADDPSADALFLSCTALRAAVCAQRIEDRLGKPVITSNQALIWRCLRLAGLNDPVTGYGRIFQF